MIEEKDRYIVLKIKSNWDANSVQRIINDYHEYSLHTAITMGEGTAFLILENDFLFDDNVKVGLNAEGATVIDFPPYPKGAA